MKHLVFHFDVISPFAWLAFQRLPQVLEGITHEVAYRPLLLAGLLAHFGQKGPAEVEPKRVWTFRQVHWLAAQHGIPLQAPAVHPFNPLALQRLALACGPNRRVVEALFRHVWAGDGADANEPARLAALTEQLAPARDPNSAELKAELRHNTEAAAAAGIFGVPMIEWEGRHFWGLDALPMLRDALRDGLRHGLRDGLRDGPSGGSWFDSPACDEAAAPRPGVRRG